MNRDRTLFLTRAGCVSCLRACVGARLLLQSYQYPNLSEGADRVGGQLHGDKESPFSGVTKSGRVWRKVPESDARSVPAFSAREDLGADVPSCVDDNCTSLYEIREAAFPALQWRVFKQPCLLGQVAATQEYTTVWNSRMHAVSSTRLGH